MKILNKKYIFSLLLSAGFFSAINVSAWTAGDQPGGQKLQVQNTLSNIIEQIWIIFAAFAVIMFVWAGMLFLTASGDPSKLDKARKAVAWGVVGVAIGILAFSIVSIVSDILSGAGVAILAQYILV